MIKISYQFMNYVFSSSVETETSLLDNEIKIIVPILIIKAPKKKGESLLLISTNSPETIGPTVIPIFIPILIKPMVDPIPNFLPSLTLKAVAPAMAVAVPIAKIEERISNCQKVLVSGTSPVDTRINMLPLTAIHLRLNLSAITPLTGPRNEIIIILIDNRSPICVGLK